MADDYTTICRNNTDRLTQAYLALQVENVRQNEEIEQLTTLASDAFLAWDKDKDSTVGKLLRAMLDPNFRATYKPGLKVGAGDTATTHNEQLTGAARHPVQRRVGEES
jgi:hypothetical protein